jgi:glycosyltransferase involved in cell wall biosynthesis
MDFSIIIPAKNEEINISNCLDSIRAINYPTEKYEVIVVDNGSSDQTVEIATSKGAKVFVLPDLTISALRNYGASQAEGQILAFLDADCTVDSDWLKAAATYLDADDVVSFGSPAILPDVTTWVQRAWFPVRGKQVGVFEVDWHESANVFVRKDAFEVVGGFDESLVTCEDYDLSVRLRKYGRLLSDDRIRAIHHREPATISEFYSKELWRATSNRERLLGKKFDFHELPSLLLPLIYLFLGVLTVVCFLALNFFDTRSMVWGFLLLLFAWQGPLIFIAIWKNRNKFRFLESFQLYLLVNVYFLARGVATIRKSA